MLVAVPATATMRHVPKPFVHLGFRRRVIMKATLGHAAASDVERVGMLRRLARLASDDFARAAADVQHDDRFAREGRRGARERKTRLFLAGNDRQHDAQLRQDVHELAGVLGVAGGRGRVGDYRDRGAILGLKAVDRLDEAPHQLADALDGFGVEASGLVDPDAEVADGGVAVQLGDSAAFVDVSHEKAGCDGADVDGRVTSGFVLAGRLCHGWRSFQDGDDESRLHYMENGEAHLWGQSPTMRKPKSETPRKGLPPTMINPGQIVYWKGSSD